MKTIQFKNIRILKSPFGGFRVLFFLILFPLWGLGGWTEGGFGLHAQNRFIRFYEPYSPPFTHSESYGLVETGYGYMLAGLTRDTTDEGYAYSAYTLLGIDFNGNQLWQKKYGDSVFSFGDMRWGAASHLVKQGGYYYSVGKVYNSHEKTFSVIFKFNEQGDTLWMKQYRSNDPANVKLIMRSIDSVPGGELVVAGYEDGGAAFKGFLLKLDTLGNVIWKKSPSDLISGTVHAVVYDSVRDKYIVQKSGATGSYIYIYNNQFVMEKRMDLTRFTFISNIQTLADGNFIACGDTVTQNTEGYRDFVRSYLIKFDIDGHVLWSRQYGKEGPVSTFAQVKVLPGDTLVAAGTIDTCNVHNMPLDNMFHLYKVTPDGEVIWGRYINIFDTFNVSEVLQSVILTRDGGYALTGFIQYRNPDPFVLAKTDAEGCVIENCENIGIGIAGIAKEEELSFSIYPNPASDEIHFKLESLPKSPATVEIRGLMGKRIASFKLESGELKSYSTAKMPDGVYFVRLIIDKQYVKTQKIIINH